MPRRTDAELGRIVRLALKGHRLKPRRWYMTPGGYEEGDLDFLNNNSDAMTAVLEALIPERRKHKSEAWSSIGARKKPSTGRS